MAAIPRRVFLGITCLTLAPASTWAEPAQPYVSRYFMQGLSGYVSGIIDIVDKASKAINEYTTLSSFSEDLSKKLEVLGLVSHIAEFFDGIQEDLFRHPSGPIPLTDSRTIDQGLAFESWLVATYAKGSPLGVVATLAPEFTRLAFDLTSSDPDREDRAIVMLLKLNVKGLALVAGNLAASAILAALGAETVPAAAVLAVGIAAADLAGGAYDMILKKPGDWRKMGSELAEAGAQLAAIFGAICHAAERIGLPLKMSIQEFFGNRREVLDLIDSTRAAAANTRYDDHRPDVFTRRSTDDWTELCIPYLCIRTYKRKPEIDESWWYRGGPHGGGENTQNPPRNPPPPPELLGGVTVNPNLTTSGKNPDQIGNAALKARPPLAHPGGAATWKINPP
jgi:hypothetical protein